MLYLCFNKGVEIYLIRHTTVEVSLEVTYGQTDVGLAPTFKEEFETLKAKIPDPSELIFISSPLKRCRQLTEYLCKDQFILDDRLKEIYLGDWEMTQWKFIEQNLFLGWKGDFVNQKSPNGESYKDLYIRSVEFYQELIKKEYQKVALVTHMGVIRAIIAHILNMPVDKAFSLKLEYGGVSKIQLMPHRSMLLFFNR